VARLANTQSPGTEYGAVNANAAIDAQFASRQQAFLDFVLAHYVQDGVEELDQSKLPTLLRLRYGTIPDAIEYLGDAEVISQAFIGFQKYLYRQPPTSLE
jgi:type I restriction enzyme R subunit